MRAGRTVASERPFNLQLPLRGSHDFGRKIARTFPSSSTSLLPRLASFSLGALRYRYGVVWLTTPTPTRIWLIICVWQTCSDRPPPRFLFSKVRLFAERTQHSFSGTTWTK